MKLKRSTKNRKALVQKNGWTGKSKNQPHKKMFCCKNLFLLWLPDSAILMRVGLYWKRLAGLESL